MLLILAGISIMMLTGDNGILTRAGEARDKSKEAQKDEEVKVAVLGSYNSRANLDIDKLLENLNGIKDITVTPTQESGTNTFPVIVETEYTTYEITSDGDFKEVVVADRTGISVGDYITYTSPTTSVTFSDADTGYSDYATTPATLTAKNTFRVMDIDRYGNMKLLGEVASEDPVIQFYGAKGYNNAVYALDTKCNDLYKNTTLGITAQSVKLEDITDRFIDGTTGITSSNSTGKAKLAKYISEKVSGLSTGANIKGIDENKNIVTYSKAKSFYPDIYEHQEGAGINIYSESESKYTGEVFKKGDKDSNGQKIIGKSDKYYSALTSNTSKQASTNLTVKYTSYYATPNASDFDSQYGDTTKLNNMFFGTNITYWIASRCSGCWSYGAGYSLGLVDHTSLDSYSLLYSDGEEDGWLTYHVRPVVTIPASVQVTKGSNPTAGTTAGAHTVVIP